MEAIIGVFVTINEMWKYDISTNMWTWMNGVTNGVFPVSGVWGPHALQTPVIILHKGQIVVMEFPVQIIVETFGFMEEMQALVEMTYMYYGDIILIPINGQRKSIKYCELWYARCFFYF